MHPFNLPLLNLLLNVGILLLAIGFLWKGADFLVEAAGSIAKRFNVSELVIGLTIVAFGTSAPEFAVTISAAIKGQSNISVGNIVGSNIFNLGFILGTVAMIAAIKASKKLVYRDGSFIFLVTLLLLFFFRDLHLARYEGALMMGILVSYLLVLFIKKEPLDDEEVEEIEAHSSLTKDILILLASLIAVAGGGHFLVESASFIASAAGLSDWVIGVTIVAAGTSAPEMATSLTAVLKGRHGLSIGNLIGSDLFNILGVLGLAGVLNPMTIDPSAYSSLLMLVGMVALVIFFLRTGWRVSRLEGAILVAIGILRWVMDFTG